MFREYRAPGRFIDRSRIEVQPGARAGVADGNAEIPCPPRDTKRSVRGKARAIDRVDCQQGLRLAVESANGSQSLWPKIGAGDKLELKYDWRTPCRQSANRDTCEDEDKTGFAMRLEAVILPDLGTGPDVPIIVSHWFAARGERVWEGDRLVEVLVGPATFDVPAPVTGRLAEIRGWEEDRVAPGAVLGLVAAAEDRDGDQEDDTPSGRRTA
jgi:hypothetical protein